MFAVNEVLSLGGGRPQGRPEGPLALLDDSANATSASATSALVVAALEVIVLLWNTLLVLVLLVIAITSDWSSPLSR